MLTCTFQGRPEYLCYRYLPKSTVPYHTCQKLQHNCFGMSHINIHALSKLTIYKHVSALPAGNSSYLFNLLLCLNFS